MLSPTTGQIPKHYSPVRHSSPESKLSALPFDLHVLGMPPAFNLSQDQTLQFKAMSFMKRVIPKQELREFCFRSLVSRVLRHDTRPHTNYLVRIVKEQADASAWQTDKCNGLHNSVNTQITWKRVVTGR